MVITLTNIEKIDYAYKMMEAKYKKHQAIISIKNFLTRLEPKLITGTNGAREYIESFSSFDLFEILADYSVTKFVKEKFPITLTEEEITILGYDLEGKFNIHPRTAIEFFTVYNAINPFFARTALSCSKNIKPLLISSFVEDRYNNPKPELFDNEDIAKIITLNKNGKDVKYMMSKNTIHQAVATMKKEEMEENFDFKLQ